MSNRDFLVGLFGIVYMPGLPIILGIFIFKYFNLKKRFDVLLHAKEIYVSDSQIVINVVEKNGGEDI